MLLLALAIPYMMLRLREARSAQQDPQLGLRTALYFFFSVGILLVLNGLTVLVVDMMTDRKPAAAPKPAGPGFGVMPAPVAQPAEEFPNSAQRTGAALVLSGIAFTLLHLGLVKALTRDE